MKTSGVATAVYIVDDDAALRLSLIALIGAALCYDVRAFPSGDDFLAEQAVLAPGSVILDYDMPGRDGLAVLEHIRKDVGRFEVIFLTGQGDVALAVRALKAGAFDFLEKPCDPEVIVATLEQSLRRLEQSAAVALRAQEAERKVLSLSKRESQVLTQLIYGRPNKIIAHELAISPRTVEMYRANVMDKLGVSSLSEALRIAFAAGLVSAD